MNRKDFSILYFIFYILMGIFSPYLYIYFNHLHFSGTQIGIQAIVSPVIILLTINLWGILIDISGSYGKILSLLFGAAGVSSLIFLKLSGFIDVLILNIIFSFFFAAISPLLDAGAVTNDVDKEYLFGHMRKWGSIGFCVAAPVTGILINRYDITIIFKLFFLVAIMGLIFIVYKIIINRNNGDKIKKLSKKNYVNDIKSLLSAKGMIYFMIGTFIFYLTINANFVLYGLYFKKYVGIEFWLGISWMIGASTEVIIFPITKKILKNIRPEVLLILTSILLTIRWLLFGLFSNIYIVMLVQAFHGIMFAFSIIGSIYFLKQYSTENIKNSTQTYLNTLSYGIAGIAGNLIVGLLMDRYNYQICYIILSMISIIGIIAFVKLSRIKIAVI